MIETIELKGNRNEIKGKLKQIFSLLTGDNLLFLDCKKDELIERLQFKSGKTKKEIRKLFSGLIDSVSNIFCLYFHLLW